MTTTPGGSSLAALFSPERILVVLPALVGAGVAALLLTAGATPLMVQRQQEQEVVKEMRPESARRWSPWRAPFRICCWCCGSWNNCR